MALTWRFFALAVLCAAPAALMPTTQTIAVLAGALIVVAVLDWLWAPNPRRIEVQRTPGKRIRLGDETSAVLSLRNPGTRTLRMLVRDAWTPTAGASDTRFRRRLAPGESLERELALTPVRRGILHADRVTLRSHSPLGICARQVSLEVPASITVMPPFRSRRHLPSKLRRLRELEGRTAVMLRGAGTEFDSLREYVRGDDVRSIDWRATARAQDLIVRTYRPERDRRVVIVVDSSRLAARRVGDETAFDAAVEASLLLAGLAAGSGDRVDVLVADARVRTRIGYLSRQGALATLLHRIAPIEPVLLDADWEAIASAVLRTTAHRALVVLVTPLDAAVLSEDVLPSLPAIAAKHTVAVASVADPALTDLASGAFSTSQAYLAAAAERELIEARSLIHALSAAGVHSVHESPENLPPALADLYIRLKASGRL